MHCKMPSADSHIIFYVFDVLAHGGENVKASGVNQFGGGLRQCFRQLKLSASRPPFGHIWALAILIALSRDAGHAGSGDILSRVIMKKFLLFFVVFLMSATATFAADDEHEQDRVRETGTVLKEILNIPDDIPRDLLDKAECLIILPSVKKRSLWDRRQLWPRRNGVPERRTLQG